MKKKAFDHQCGFEQERGKESFRREEKKLSVLFTLMSPTNFNIFTILSLSKVVKFQGIIVHYFSIYKREMLMNALRILVNNLFKKSFYLVSMALYKIRYSLCSGDTTCNSLKKKITNFFIFDLYQEHLQSQNQEYPQIKKEKKKRKPKKKFVTKPSPRQLGKPNRLQRANPRILKLNQIRNQIKANLKSKDRASNASVPQSNA